MFSSRLPARLTRNALSEARVRLRAAGVQVLDLTETNPTAVGLPYPEDVLAALANPRGAIYDPSPLGLGEAREAVCETYARRGIAIDPAHSVLTASTSEAYSFLFKLLADPSDRLLVPQPSYPLFDLLAGLDGLSTAPYRLDPMNGWAIDRQSLERALAPNVRALVVVSPNNPTGSFVRSADREWLVSVAADRGLAIVADEVFADYPVSPRPDATSFAGEERALTFTLGGLSKLAGLPQVKLAWIALSGPDKLVGDALERIEVIADTYLSVSTPVQLAAPLLIDAGRRIRQTIAARLEENLACLRSAVASHPALTLLEPEGGWSAVLRIPATVPEEAVVLRLLNEAHVLVHPGYFFDFSEEAFLVLSLLPDPRVFEHGLSRLADVVAGSRR